MLGMRFLRRLFGPKSLVAVSVSECGPCRSENQDHVFADAVDGLFAVADGMGGGMGGGKASEIVVRKLDEAADILGRVADTGGRIEIMAAVLAEANVEVRKYAAEHGFNQMGTTVVALAIDPRNPAVAAFCHAGDSRLYRVRGGAAECLTRDHTIGAELDSMMVSRGIDARRHPLSHVLTRAVGSRSSLHLDWDQIKAEPGDRFLLCSDGVHGVIGDVELGRLASRGNLREALALMKKAVEKRGAPDNFSIVLVERSR